MLQLLPAISCVDLNKPSRCLFCQLLSYPSKLPPLKLRSTGWWKALCRCVDSEVKQVVNDYYWQYIDRGRFCMFSTCDFDYERDGF